MSTEKVIYETGATSHAVNDLILFTDNAGELAELRDTIYKRMISYTGDLDLTTKFFSDWNKLHLKAKKEYKRIFPKEDDHIHFIQKGYNSTIGTWTEDDTREFIVLYIQEFKTWKSEHGYK